MTDLLPVVPPNLPLALNAYDRQWNEQFNNVLRLYFNSLSNAVNQLATTVNTLSSNGSTSPLTTKGDLYGFSTLPDRFPVGVDGKVVTADSTTALGIAWKDPDILVGKPKYQVADLLRNSTTYIDTDLVVDLDAGIYAVEVVRGFTPATTGGFKGQLTYTGTSSNVLMMNATWGAATGNSVFTALPATGTATTVGLHMSHLRGAFTADTSGTLSFQVALNSASGNNLTFNANSWMRITKLT